MKTDRKGFIKSTCMAGAALCGFSAIGFTGNSSQKKSGLLGNTPDDQALLQRDYISKLISGIASGLPESEIRDILKGCAIVHYNNLKMDELLSPFIGNLEGFLKFISDNWGWKIDYDKETGILIGDENKSFCVCPMVNQENNTISDAICYCSEGFSEKMFSVVTGKPVKATVISSVFRGDKSCKYKIEFKI